jgi:hypothetical protein
VAQRCRDEGEVTARSAGAGLIFLFVRHVPLLNGRRARARRRKLRTSFGAPPQVRLPFPRSFFLVLSPLRLQVDPPH